MDTIVQALQNFFSEYVVALAVLIVAAVWAVWKLATAFQSMREKVKGVEDLPCHRHSAKIDRHDELFEDTKALMSRLESQLVKHDDSLNDTKVLMSRMEGQLERLEMTFQSTRDKVKGIEDLPCSYHSARIEKLDDSLADTRMLMSRMEGQLVLLVRNSIEKSNDEMQNTQVFEYSAKQSPRRLNKLGEELLKRSGGDRFISENLDFFVRKLEELAPKTALDVEYYSSAVLLANTNEDIFIPLKVWVYNEPTREVIDDAGNKKIQDVSLNDVVYVMSLPLRDKYLELHPELPR